MQKAIGDSSAVLEERLFSHHQAALTLIQERLQHPEVKDFNWLDLGCGRGQIILHLQRNLQPASRGKVNYFAFDVKGPYVASTQRIADTLGFKTVNPTIKPLSSFDQEYAAEEKFDFITFTNTVHELSPKVISSTIVDCLIRLKPDGSLFMYDFESFSKDEWELGALLWTRAEIQELLRDLVAGLGVPDCHLEVGQWPHKTCLAWNVNINRKHLGLSHAQLLERRGAAVEQLHKQTR